ncbi:MAG: serine/threonine protein kinase, partial [Phycisphaerales bacterium]|nr:serine/threonine protein kinase [Phycisphaerales bacterium]
YLAIDEQLGRPVAIKIPKLGSDDSQDVHDRFLREAKAAATIQHPNICPVYEFGELDGQLFLVMSYVEGAPLSRYIAKDKPIPERQAALLIRKLALALQEAHEKGVLHRDLKPANIIIDRRKEPVIMDFGLARRDQHDDTRLTRTGTFMGTPAYSSPEQIRNEPYTVGAPTDIYALGVILFELLTGQLPFEGTSMMSVLGKVLADE